MKVKAMTFIVSVLAVFCLLGGYGTPVLAGTGTSPSSSAVQKTVDERAGEITSQTERTKALLHEDQKALQARLKALKASVAGLKDSLKEKKSRFAALQKKEGRLKEALSSERQEADAVQGTLVTGAKHLAKMLRSTPLGPAMPKDLRRLEALAASNHPPRMEDVRSVVESCLAIIARSSRIEQVQGTYLDGNGRERNGTLVRIGGISAAYNSPHGSGYLEPGPQGREYMAVPGEVSWFTGRSLRSYLAGQTDSVPLDVSKGSVFARMARERSWGEWIRAGGVLVWPLIAIALLALGLVGERLVFMLRIRVNSARIMDEVMHMAEKGNWEQCREFCAQHLRYPLCRVLGKALEHAGESRQVVENALQEGILGQLPRLERFLPTLSVLAAIAPLLGLLGTVTGMISTFQAITVFGTGEPKVMAGGISEALITTQLGLAVAVPIMFVHHLLDRRVDKVVGDLEEKGTALSTILSSTEGGIPVRDQGREAGDA